MVSSAKPVAAHPVPTRAASQWSAIAAFKIEDKPTTAPPRAAFNKNNARLDKNNAGPNKVYAAPNKNNAGLDKNNAGPNKNNAIRAEPSASPTRCSCNAIDATRMRRSSRPSVINADSNASPTQRRHNVITRRRSHADHSAINATPMRRNSPPRVTRADHNATLTQRGRSAINATPTPRSRSVINATLTPHSHSATNTIPTQRHSVNNAVLSVRSSRSRVHRSNAPRGSPRPRSRAPMWT